MKLKRLSNGVMLEVRLFTGRRVWVAITPKDRVWYHASSRWGSWIVRMGPVGVWSA